MPSCGRPYFLGFLSFLTLIFANAPLFNASNYKQVENYKWNRRQLRFRHLQCFDGVVATRFGLDLGNYKLDDQSKVFFKTAVKFYSESCCESLAADGFLVVGAWFFLFQIEGQFRNLADMTPTKQLHTFHCIVVRCW